MELMLQEPKLTLLTNCITFQATALRAKVKNEQKKSVRKKQNLVTNSIYLTSIQKSSIQN